MIGEPGPARSIRPEIAPEIAVVVSDVDGTLLTSDHTLSTAVRETVRAVVGQGRRFLLASARAPRGIVFLYRELGIPVEPVVALNGALVVDADGRPLLRAVMPGDAALAVLAMASTYGLTPNALVDGRWMVTSRDAWVREEERAVGYAATEVDDLRPMAGDGFEKILLMGSVDRIERWEAHLASRADLHGRIRATRSNPCYVEVTEHGVSKCSAVLFLLNHLGIAPSAMMAIGDGMNDRELLQAAGLGVAMGHAPPEVRAAAAAVTGSNNEDGVAIAIRTWLLGKDLENAKGGL